MVLIWLGFALPCLGWSCTQFLVQHSRKKNAAELPLYAQADVIANRDTVESCKSIVGSFPFPKISVLCDYNCSSLSGCFLSISYATLFGGRSARSNLMTDPFLTRMLSNSGQPITFPFLLLYHLQGTVLGSEHRWQGKSLNSSTMLPPPCLFSFVCSSTCPTPSHSPLCPLVLGRIKCQFFLTFHLPMDFTVTRPYSFLTP